MIHPPKNAEDVFEFQPIHAVSEALDFDRVLSAHSRIPWMQRMEYEYGQGGNEGCYICWLLAEILWLRKQASTGGSDGGI